MKPLLVHGGTLVGPSSLLKDNSMLVEEGRITAVRKGAGEGMEEVEKVDASGLFVWPGMIDLHIHGARGDLIGPEGEGALEAISGALPEKGVTRFLATVPPLPLGTMEREVRRLAKIDGEGLTGAGSLGLHLEGPFLNAQRSGVLSTDDIRYPELAEFKVLLEAAEGKLRMMTLAPELPSALEVIEWGREQGTVMAGGHTEASFKEMNDAIQRGLTHLTHCFNAMRRISHRNPGPVEAALTSETVTVDVICDGRHVHKPLVDMMIRCKGFDRVAVISDATAFQTPDGSMSFQGRQLEVQHGLVRDKQTGALGGSSISLLEAIRALYEWFHFPFPTLARLSALNPARIMGKDRDFGSLEVGKAGDFFLSDENLEIRQVFRDGRRIWPA
jgi:N-acetylglucosamine-6-phosphate deacetylase